MKKTKMNTLKIVELAVLVALVAVLQITGTGVNITGTPISLVLIPIVLGAMLLGPAAGALLGLEFGIIVYVAGFIGVDGFTFILVQDHPIYTALICIGKGVLAGFGAGVIYRLVAAKNKIVAVFAASAATPIINTALFILGALGMQNTLSSNFLGEGQTVIYFLVVVCAGVNFLLELLLNLLVAPALARVTDVFNRRIGR
jgi:uncharacterized membrane protein